MTMILRLLGIVFLLAAVTVAVLNLKRVADLGLLWLSPILIVLGAACIALSRRRQR